MAIIKTRKESNYVCIDNSVLEDKRLSLKAKGLLAYLLTKPESWQIKINHLVNQSTDGKGSHYSTIKELINAGYITKKQLHIDGRLSVVEYSVYEKPHSKSKLQQSELQLAEIQHAEIQDAEIQDAEIRTLVSTDSSKTDISNKICSAKESVSHETGFSEFWKQWPSGYKTGKKICLEYWKRHNLKEKAHQIASDVARRKEMDTRWGNGYIPNPITYLRQERWDDDMVVGVTKRTIDDIKREKMKEIANG